MIKKDLFSTQPVQLMNLNHQIWRSLKCHLIFLQQANKARLFFCLTYLGKKLLQNSDDFLYRLYLSNKIYIPFLRFPYLLLKSATNKCLINDFAS